MSKLLNTRNGKSKVSMHLILILLFLRFPLLFLGQYGVIDENWALVIYLCATYLFTCIFICCNRSRLDRYHISAGALFLALLSPLMALFSGNDDFTVWLRLCAGIICGGVLVIKRNELKLCKITKKEAVIRTVLIIILSAAVPLIIHVVTGFPRHQGNESVTVSMVIELWFFQLSYAAVSEEPLFRGFIMGFLKDKGMNGLAVCITQALIFWMGHIYYVETGINFWIIHPLLAFLLGVVVWKMKSISYSMILHSSVNAFGDILRYIKF